LGFDLLISILLFSFVFLFCFLVIFAAQTGRVVSSSDGEGLCRGLFRLPSDVGAQSLEGSPKALAIAALA